MTITIEGSQEAIEVAQALLNWTKDGLKRAGALVHRINEDPHYTEQRELLRALELFLKRRI